MGRKISRSHRPVAVAAGLAAILGLGACQEEGPPVEPTPPRPPGVEGTALDFTVAKLRGLDSAICSSVTPQVRVVANPHELWVRDGWHEPTDHECNNFLGPVPTGPVPQLPDIPEGMTLLEFMPILWGRGSGYVVTGIYDSGTKWTVALDDRTYPDTCTDDAVCFGGIIYVEGEPPDSVDVRVRDIGLVDDRIE